jgi:hypothetical protein
LRLTASGDGCALDDHGVEVREPFVVESAKVQGDVESREGGFLQGERGGTCEVTLGEIEEGEDAERLAGSIVEVARDLRGGEEVVGGKLEVYLGVGALRHVEVEDESAVVGNEVADDGGLRVGGLSFAVADDEGNLLGLSVANDKEHAKIVG